MSSADVGTRPDVTFIVPSYNEESVVGYTIPRLLGAFKKAGYALEIIALDNGSHDRTGEIIRSLAAHHPNVVPHRVEVNEGYGNGVIQCIPLCSAPWVGIIPADGQVDAEDVVRLYEAACVAGDRVVAKVRRRFRMDGPLRKVVSVGYNLLFRAMWPRLESIDINGSPKLMPRDVLSAMQLKSKRWFLDPELMIKAHYMGLRVLEFNVFARMRGNGLSHVRAGTCWEFLRELLSYRFTRRLADWRRGIEADGWGPGARVRPEPVGTTP